MRFAAPGNAPFLGKRFKMGRTEGQRGNHKQDGKCDKRVH
jgi:hypothetical protein